jgi:hypothetical protein
MRPSERILCTRRSARRWLEVTAEVVEGVGDSLRWAEIRRIEGGDTTITHRAAAVAKATRAFQLHVGSVSRIEWVRIEGGQTRWAPAGTGLALHDDEEAGTGAAGEDRHSVHRPERTHRSAVGAGDAEEGHTRTRRGGGEQRHQCNEIRCADAAVPIDVAARTAARGCAEHAANERCCVEVVDGPIAGHVAGALPPGRAGCRTHGHHYQNATQQHPTTTEHARHVFRNQDRA